MPATQSISTEKLIRLVGTPHCPRLVDVRADEDFARLPAFVPGAGRRPVDNVCDWIDGLGGDPVVAICQNGGGRSASVAAWLRAHGIAAEILEGGIAAWAAAALPLVPAASLPPRHADGRTVWVTRSRPKVDRIACPWLIRRFVDRDALFLFAAPAEVVDVAERMDATAFDVDGVFWSHRGEQCTFDTMIEEFDLARLPGLARLAVIVRGADTARPELAPQCAGLLAASLGLSRLHADDHAQLEAGMGLYDAFYRWCRDAVDETHDWVSHQPRGKARPAAPAAPVRA